ncbi:MAG: Cadmium-translocating P-type ATPase [Desulfonauticus sp. 38_4375]|nr:MAG: Cadmium-translocating P-type ATPase [Desulfonauticus sp. 38_4375]
MANGCSCCSSGSCTLPLSKEEVKSENRAFYLSIGLGSLFFGLALISEHFFNFSFSVYLYLLSYLFLGYDILFSAFKSILKGLILDEMFLMSIASMGAFFIAAYAEACAVMLFFKVGEHLQEKALDKSRRTISSLLALKPEVARVLRLGTEVLLPPEEVKVREIIEVQPGERIPLDGEVIEGISFVDTSALTGEGVPKRVRPGKKVLGGSVNGSGLLKIRVTHPYRESALAKVLELVEKSGAKKARVEKMITRLAKVYTPVVVGLALLIAFLPPLLVKWGLVSLGDASFSTWLYRGLVFLVISCPCALVLSIPLGFFAGIGGASKKGILVKGASYLELLSRVKTVVWDKTGTLTKGNFKVKKILPAPSSSEEEVLFLAALLESKVNHPIANSILEEAQKKGLLLQDEVQKVEVVEGKGVRGEVKGRPVLLGSKDFLEENRIAVKGNGEAGTEVYLAYAGEFKGSIVIEDELKPESKKTLQLLQKMGIKRHVLLTGDVPEIALKIANYLGIKEVFAGLLPQDKVFHLEKLLQEKSQKEAVACVGDGINDAPMLRLADVGIAMGEKGVDMAMESADVVLMQDNPFLLVEAISRSKKTLQIIWQNIFLAFGIKGLVLFLGSLGLATMWMAIFADVGVALLAVLNSMRAFK